MSIDVLHDKIRKLKNPLVVDFGVKQDSIPGFMLEEEGSLVKAYSRFCRELLEGMKGVVPAVRFSFGAFSLLGPEGLVELTALLHASEEAGFYVVLDGPEILSPWGADRTAEIIFQSYPCDALVISPYIGSDAIKPFVSCCKEDKKDLFVVVRSPNKTAAELQDLMTGSRLVHAAAADLVKRYGDPIFGKCGYSRISALVSAGAPDSLRNLRTKYPHIFLLVDGMDYPSGNAKNCSHAFDRFGYGAAVCVGPSVTAAWKDAESDGRDYVAQALQAADRIKKNLNRYITIL